MEGGSACCVGGRVAPRVTDCPVHRARCESDCECTLESANLKNTTEKNYNGQDGEHNSGNL